MLLLSFHENLSQKVIPDAAIDKSQKARANESADQRNQGNESGNNPQDNGDNNAHNDRDPIGACQDFLDDAVEVKGCHKVVALDIVHDAH